MKDQIREFKGHITLAIIAAVTASIVDSIAQVLSAFFGG